MTRTSTRPRRTRASTLTSRAALIVWLATAAAAGGLGCDLLDPPSASPTAKKRASKKSRKNADAVAAKSDAGPRPAASAPAVDESELFARLAHLVGALRDRDATLATDMVLPRAAADDVLRSNAPRRSWDDKIMPHYRRDIERVGKKLDLHPGASVTRFVLGSTERVSSEKGSVVPGVWIAHRSRISILDDGRAHEVVIAEMVAWRGHWYVLKLA